MFVLPRLSFFLLSHKTCLCVRPSDYKNACLYACSTPALDFKVARLQNTSPHVCALVRRGAGKEVPGPGCTNVCVCTAVAGRSVGQRFHG